MAEQCERRSSRFQRIRRVVYLALSVIVTWWAASRITSLFRAVTVTESGAQSAIVTPQVPSLLRIATYNIAHGRGVASGNWSGGSPADRETRLLAIAKLLGESEVDVVVLNEVDFNSTWSGGINQAKYLADQLGLSFRAEQTNIDLALPFLSWRFGNAVLSRYPITDARLVDLPAPSGVEAVVAAKKRGLLCTIDPGEGREFRVLAVHLEPRSRFVRLESAHCLSRVAGEDDIPLVICGDFNSTLLGISRSATDTDGESALTSLIRRGNLRATIQDESSGRGFTFPSALPSRTIDWILIPREWAVISHSVPRADLSDHLPVIAEVAPTPRTESNAGKTGMPSSE